MSSKREKQKEFLEAYLEYGTQLRACAAVGLSPGTLTKWRKEARFLKAMDEVKAAVADDLETTAIQRAKAGSDNLLIFLLKGHKPEKFRERVDSRNTHGADDSLKELLGAVKPTVGPPKKREE